MIFPGLLFLSIWLGMFSSYHAQEKTIPLNDDRFVLLYVENTLLTEKYLNQQDSLKIFQDQLFQNHKTTREEFINFLKHYDEEPEKFTPIWQKITNALDEHHKNTTQPEIIKDRKTNPVPDKKKSK